MLNESIAGAVTLIDVLLQFPQYDPPFGGVGPSGMGQYHGQEGFSTSSNCKALFIQPRLNTSPLLKPPFGKLLTGWLRIVLL